MFKKINYPNIERKDFQHKGELSITKIWYFKYFKKKRTY